MDASINNSYTLPPDFSVTQAATSESSDTTTTGKSSSQGQSTLTSTSDSTSSFSSLQGAQGEAGQNINATLGQALGTAQGALADASATGGGNELSGILNKNDEGTPQLVDSGLRADQQVAGQQGSKGKRDSDTGSGSQSERSGVYLGTAASGLQKGQGIRSSTAIGSIHSTSTFTLKVDSSDSTTSTATTQSTSYTDSNGAPSIPPGPNVFAMIANCTQLSENLNSYTVTDMVAANKGQNAILSQDYAKQITDINNYISEKNQAQSKGNFAKTFSWVMNIAMIVVGVLTADPMFIAGGVMGCILTADPKITAGLTNALEQMGIPSQAASILSTLIFVGAACVSGLGVGAIGMSALKAGSAAALDAVGNAGAESAANTVSETATSSGEAAGDTASEAAQAAGKSADQTINYSETFQALRSSSAARSAFIKGSSEGAMRTITDAPANIASSVANVPTSIANSAASLYQLAARVSDACISLGSKSLSDMLSEIGFISLVPATEVAAEGASTSAKAAAAAEQAMAATQSSMASLFSNLTSMEPIRMVQIAADLTMGALTGAGSVVNFNASELTSKAEKDQAFVQQSQAQTTELSALIGLGNTQIKTVLDDMNQAVVGSGQILSAMSSLSSETIGQLSA